MTENQTWVLTDWYGSRYGDHVYPKIPVRSPDHLKTTLEEFARREPRLLDLVAPDGFRISLAVGGLLAAVTVHGPEHGQPGLSAVTDAPRAAGELCFVGEWQPSYYLARYLLPVEDVIAIVLEVYQTRQPPGWVKWEV